MSFKKIITWLVVSVVVANFGLLILRFAHHWKFYQWDFHSYYYAGKSYAQGLNPYSLDSYNKLSGGDEAELINYPPQSLWLFSLLALFKFRTAYYLFLGIKCLLLVGLFFIWAKFFLKSEADIWFYPFALLAFNTSIFVDIAAGNFVVYEQFILWLAFYFLVKKRLLLFCILVVFIANIKILPLFFLVLLLFINHRRKYLYFFGSLFSFGLINLVCWLTSPIYQYFLKFSAQTMGRLLDPSSYTLVWQILAWKGPYPEVHPRYPWLSIVHPLCYLVLVGVVAVISWWAASRVLALKTLEEADKTRLLIFFSCLVYALTVPRFNLYTHMILIVPAYFAAKKFVAGAGGVLLFIIVALQLPSKAATLGMDKFLLWVWAFYPLWIALGLWVVYLLAISRSYKSGQPLWPELARSA